jgi:hypothetical protein
MSVTVNQQKIYNQHLASYKQRQGKPYTQRANFESFSEDKPEEYLALMKLDKFFTNHPYVNRKLFFNAPYYIHSDREYVDLCFYTSQAAIKCYTLYLKQLEEQSPDSDSQMEYILDTLAFIRDFCIEHKIGLRDYFKHIDGVTYSWAKNYAANNTSIYVLYGFEFFNIQVYNLMIGMPPDERALFFEDALNNHVNIKEKLNKSKKAKQLIIKGIQEIDKIIKEHLKTPQIVVR